MSQHVRYLPVVMLPADTRLYKPRWGIVGLSGGLRMLGTAYQAPLGLILPKESQSQSQSQTE